MNHLLGRLRHLVRTRRRLVAAVVTALAMAAALSALQPSRDGGVPVVVAARPVAAGAPLTAGDLTVRHYPPHLAPTGAHTSPAELVGRVVTAGLSTGDPLSSHDVLDAQRVGHGRALVPLRLNDPAVVSLLRVGDRVTVHGSDDGGNPVLLARHARVAAIPASRADTTFGDSSAPLVIVDVDSRTAERLGVWATNPGLSVSIG